MSEINFKSASVKGDIIEIGIRAIKFGATSITLCCEVRNVMTREVIITIDTIVMVSLDQDGKPKPHGKSIMAYSHVAHDCFIGDNCIFSNNSTLAGHVTVGAHVILAGMVAVHQFCSIGNHAFVAGGSLVRKDVPPFVKAAREPLSYVGINSVGLRRRGFDSKVIMEIQSMYRTLYQKRYNNTQAVAIMEGEMEATKERDEILQFIKNSQRGIMKGYFKN